MASDKSLYEILGISNGATDLEVRKGAKSCLIAFHA
jgi:curved DNA-binding protein CbpA